MKLSEQDKADIDAVAAMVPGPAVLRALLVKALRAVVRTGRVKFGVKA